MLFLFLSALPSDPPETDRDPVPAPPVTNGADGPGLGDEEILRLVDRAKDGDGDAFGTLVSQLLFILSL